jgi:tryptophanyl-tRNA synthetase
MTTNPVTRVLSGIQPTGNLHLGNLLGAILRWVRMQEEAPCLFFLADLHSLSDHIAADNRRAQVRAMAAALIASGIDPGKSVLFAQSDVPAHAELCWILNGTARMGWLSRMTQWKDKSGKNKEGASVALFDYPVLQAADILLYRPSHVPVGEDQKQHIELTRDIATKFNLETGTDTFVLPEPFIGGGVAARVMSLRDGSAKMSKSDSSDMSRVLARFEGQGFGAFKPALADALVALIAPIRARYEALQQEPAELDRILDAGAAKAADLAAPTLLAAKQAVGLGR